MSDDLTSDDRLDRLFEMFWESGMRKVNKKKARSIFRRVIKGHPNPTLFTEQLIFDVRDRLLNKQFGFTEMHPTTYLNGERWNDELKRIVVNDNTRTTTLMEDLTDRSWASDHAIK